jgi:hypothetical protein
MIKLHSYHRNFGLINASPFCMRLEVFCKLANIEYEFTPLMNSKEMKLAPKGKFPYITTKDGKKIGDSSFIIEYLTKEYNITLDNHLSDKEKAVSHAFTKLCTEELYWVILYLRWFDPKGWNITKEAYFGAAPKLLRNFIAEKIKKDLYKQFYGHGMGRHSHDEIYHLGVIGVTAIREYLGDNNFFMGDKPTTIDSCIYSFIANFMEPIDNPVKSFILENKNLIDYCERMRKLVNII